MSAVRVLVTGAAGFVGCHLSRLLLADRCEVYGTVLHGQSGPAGLDAVRWLEMDLASSTSVRAAVEAARPERVFHLAAQSSVGTSLAAWRFRSPTRWAPGR